MKRCHPHRVCTAAHIAQSRRIGIVGRNEDSSPIGRCKRKAHGMRIISDETSRFPAPRAGLNQPFAPRPEPSWRASPQPVSRGFRPLVGLGASALSNEGHLVVGPHADAADSRAGAAVVVMDLAARMIPDIITLPMLALSHVAGRSSSSASPSSASRYRVTAFPSAPSSPSSGRFSSRLGCDQPPRSNEVPSPRGSFVLPGPSIRQRPSHVQALEPFLEGGAGQRASVRTRTSFVSSG